MAERKFQQQEDQAAAEVQAAENEEGAVEVYVDKEGMELPQDMTLEEKAA